MPSPLFTSLDASRLIRLPLPTSCRANLAVVKSGMSHQFKLTLTTIWIVWHIFPGVWAMAWFGAITPFQEQIGMLIADLCAKFLLLFVYSFHVV